jgi:isopentenyldiphosphate isomerase
MAADSPPAGGGIDDVFPAWWKNNIRAHPVLSPADGGGGATKAKQEAAPRRLSSESTAPAPQRGVRRASTSRLR